MREEKKKKKLNPQHKQHPYGDILSPPPTHTHLTSCPLAPTRHTRAGHFRQNQFFLSNK